MFQVFGAASGERGTLVAGAPGWSGPRDRIIKDGDPLEWVKIEEYSKRSLRSLYVY